MMTLHSKVFINTKALNRKDFIVHNFCHSVFFRVLHLCVDKKIQRMNKAVTLFIITAALISCKKEKSGNMDFSMHYTTQTDVFKTDVVPDSLYTGFGDYITSVTPSHFSGKFRMLGFQDAVNPQDNTTHMLLYIHGNMTPDDPARTAVFSNNAVVSFSPDLRGIQDDHAMFTGEQINFFYFYFDIIYFYQEVALPPQYDTVNIAMFNVNYCNEQLWSDSVKVNNVLKIKHCPLIYNIFDVSNGWPEAYVFGNCDSTFVYNLEHNEVPNSVNYPFGGSTILPIIRSNKYQLVTVNTPTGGETVKMISTVGFDTQNLIQIYAGADNIPYNSDDVFIYAPNYWERIQAKLLVE